MYVMFCNYVNFVCELRYFKITTTATIQENYVGKVYTTNLYKMTKYTTTF